MRGLALFWLITKLFSYKTWIFEREFPVIAPAEFLQNASANIHFILFIVAIIFLSLVLIFPKKKFVLIFIIVELLSCSLDTVRWQPWEYMYLCIFVVYLFNFNKTNFFFLLVHLLLVSMYVFSGLHKVNRGFLSAVWVEMILHRFLNLSIDTILTYKLFFVGLLIPFTELLAGILLLFTKNKRKITYFLILVHLIILFLIGPFGLNYNPIVWGWNLAMIFLLIVVYLKPIQGITPVFLKKNTVWLLLWFGMPVFSFFGMWYQYFSSSLYTGKEKQLYIYISKENKEYQVFSEPSVFTVNQDYYVVNLQNWALKEIKSVPLPENEIYHKISISLKKKLGKDCKKIILYNPQTKEQIVL